eukprot:8415287-Karenia_brevis.AAC.1
MKFLASKLCAPGPPLHHGLTLEKLGRDTRAQLASHTNLHTLMASCDPSDWAAFARFLARVRQLKRRSNHMFTVKERRISQDSYKARKQRWVASGRWVCRHGVFFSTRRER